MNKIGDNELDEILSTLQEIEHIEIIRIGTRAIVVNPMRITDDLINIFKKYKPLWINTHFNHPKEITADAVKACTKIVDRPSDDVTQNMLVTIYKTDVETTELLEKFGITVSKDKIIDGTTLLLEPGQMQTLYRRAPYLISMSVTDLTQVKLEDIVDDEEIDFDSERKIPVPGNEPIVGVIDTQFNEKVYFHEWVEYKNMLSNDIQLKKKDYYHGTAVTSIIVDGPKGNPSVSDYYEITSEYQIDCLVTISNWNRVTQDAYELGRRNGIGVFTMSEFMGALNCAKPSVYIRPIDREDNDRAGVGFGRIG